MKKILNLIAAALIPISASAQSEVGSFTFQPNVGITIASITGDAGKNSKCAVGLTAGIEGMYMFTDKLGAAIGLNYTGYNVSVKDGAYKGKISSNYFFCIPIMVDYYVIQGLALKAGLSLNLRSTSKLDGKDNIVVDGKSIEYKSYFRRGFLTVPVGASYEINNIVFDARYNIGVRNVITDRDVESTFNAFSFTVGYKF